MVIIDKDLFKYELLDDGTYKATLEKINTLDTLVVPDEYENIPVTKVNMVITRYFRYCLKRIIFGKNITDVSFTKRGHSPRNNIRIKEYNIPAGLNYIPAILLASCANKITVDEKNERFRIIENCLVDVKDKTLLSALKKPIIPSDENVQNVYENAFLNFDKTIGTLFIPKNVKHIDRAIFNYRVKYKNIEIEEGNTNYELYKGCVIEKDTKTIIKYYGDYKKLDLKDLDIKEINKNCFVNNETLEELILPDSLVKLDEYAIALLPNIKEIRIPENVKVINSPNLYNFKSLEKITFPRILVYFEQASVLAKCPKLKEINWPLCGDGDYYLYSKDNKLPIRNTDYFRIMLPKEHVKEIVIPEDYDRISILSPYKHATIDKIICNSRCFSLGVSSEILIKDIEFKNKNAEMSFKNHTLYYKSGLFLTAFIPDNVYEYETPDEVTDLGEFVINGGKNLEKVIIGKNVKASDEMYSSPKYPKVKYMDVLNPDFDLTYFCGDAPIINIDVTKSKVYEKLAGCLITKKQHRNVTNYLPDYIEVLEQDYEEFKKLYEKNPLKPKGQCFFIGKKGLKKLMNNETTVREAFENGKLYYNDNNELKCVTKEPGEYVIENKLLLKLPCEIKTKKKVDLLYSCLAKKLEGGYKLHIPNNVTLCDYNIRVFAVDSVQVELEEDNKQYKQENGLVYEKETGELKYVPKYLLETKKIVVPEGVTKFHVNFNELKPKRNVVTYLPKSVTYIDIGDYLSQYKFVIDENNEHYYVQNNVIFERKTQKPFRYKEVC